MLDWFQAAGIIAGGFGLLGVLGKVLGWMWRTVKRIQDFLDDWQGEPARPGVPARPGFPDRIAALEEQVTGLAAQVAEVERIVSNGLSHNVADIQARLTRVEQWLTDSRGG